MKKGLLIAASALSLLVAGCASQSTPDSSATCGASTMTTAPAAANSCKGGSNCKAKAVKHKVNTCNAVAK